MKAAAEGCEVLRPSKAAAEVLRVFRPAQNVPRSSFLHPLKRITVLQKKLGLWRYLVVLVFQN